MLRLILFLFLLSIFAIACNESTLSGQWKLQKISAYDPMEKTSRTIQLNDTIQLKNELRNYLIQDARERGYVTDSSSIHNEIRQLLQEFSKAGLLISSDSSYILAHFGLIIPTVMPGWTFGDSIMGKWATNRDTLLLTIDDSIPA